MVDTLKRESILAEGLGGTERNLNDSPGKGC